MKKIALQADDGHFVTVDDNAQLMATAKKIKEREVFQMHEVGRNKIALQAFNGKYVCAEDGGGRELVANRDAIDTWETFELLGVDGGFALKADNGQYVCAEDGGGRELVANRDVIDTWETFEILIPLKVLKS